MKKTLKKYFIPHAENNYHPHILHTKRAVFYSALFGSMKLILVIFALSVPETVFVTPEVAALQEEKIIAAANDIREEQGLPPLANNVKLDSSARLKAENMAAGQYFSHTDPDGQKLAQYLRRVGYDYAVAGENLAMGYMNIADLFAAWTRSESHYRNIIDGNFEQTGVGVAVGMYDNIPTVYVTEHFGTLKKAVTAAVVTAPAAPATPAAAVVQPEKILGEKLTLAEEKKATGANDHTPAENPIAAPAEPVVATVEYRAEKSYVAWQENDQKLTLTARAEIVGPVRGAMVSVGDYTMELTRDEASGRYIGSVSPTESADEFFRVVFPPKIIITPVSGEIITAVIPWQSVKAVNLTTMERYTMARENLSPVTGIFNFSRDIYLGFLAVFVLALALNIIVEIKKQRPHIIAQTLGLIGLLVVFYIV